MIKDNPAHEYVIVSVCDILPHHEDLHPDQDHSDHHPAPASNNKSSAMATSTGEQEGDQQFSKIFLWAWEKN